MLCILRKRGANRISISYRLRSILLLTAGDSFQEPSKQWIDDPAVSSAVIEQGAGAGPCVCKEQGNRRGKNSDGT